MNDESTYICENCGEEIVIPVDLTAGNRQQYTEDCPVCCSPNEVFVEVEDDGTVRCWSRSEQDRY